IGCEGGEAVATWGGPMDAANGNVLVSALEAVGGMRAGPKRSGVLLSVPLASSTCSAFVSIDVPLKKGKAGKKNLRGCGELGKCQDSDRLQLRCLPAS